MPLDGIEWRGDQSTGLRVDQMPRRKILGAFADDAPVAQQLPVAAVQGEQREVPRVLAPNAEEHLLSRRAGVGGIRVVLRRVWVS